MGPESVAVIGLGIMGSAISANLIKAGFRVMGYDLLAECRNRHRAFGGTVARSCRHAGKSNTIVVTSLPSAEALLQTSGELAKSARPHQLVLETSTLPISVKEEARGRLAGHGITLLDCPLSGTGAQARVKDVIVFASGDRKACERAAPVMNGFARAYHYVGEFGAGSKMKFVANLLVAIHNVAAAEAMVLGMKSGLDPAMIVNAIADGAGTSRMFEVRAPMMVKGDYSEAAMKLSVWQKDMTIINDFARKLECPIPLFSATIPIYTAAMAMGRSSEDTAAVCAVLERMANKPRTHGRKGSESRKETRKRALRLTQR